MSSATPLLNQFTLPAASAAYLDMYVAPCDRLKLLVDITASSAIGTVVLTNGYGGPDIVNITTPWDQPVPLAYKLNGHTVTGVNWSSDSTSYNCTTLTSSHQVCEVVIDRSMGTPWLSVIINGGLADATINILGVTY
jgi:hypothetical protein